ncbi:hypothetical protein [Diaminobutyricimonas sp. TR449]|uniref:hypothetical protein n=1 Tax=Diaminobutyricimonas sp. TR449 TaxID=2708076 RepID=UPI001422D4B3|nr:hypothetical protein [Diaminobutyricimonas sp. TR449]
MATARDAGVPAKRLRAADIAAPFHGVRSSAEAATDVVGRCREYFPRLRPGQVFSHGTAAMIYGLRLPRRIEEERNLHVAVRHPARPPRTSGILGHEISHGMSHGQTWSGLPVIDPITAWMQLAPLLTLDELIVCGDSLVRRKIPPATLDDVLERVDRASGFRGIRNLTQAVPQIRARTDSRPETLLRLLIVRAGLPEPLVGYTVRDSNGDFVGTPDLAYPKERVGLEYLGDGHRTDRATFVDDISRTERFEQFGWRVVKVVSDDIFIRPPILIRRILAAREGR